MKAIAIIPARYASTRFPGKPLAMINNKPMIQHVYERCSEVFDLTVVATDDNRITDCVSSFNGKSILTSKNHPSGTDRCAEAAAILSQEYDFDIIVNVQGDEPFIHKKQLEEIQKCFEDKETEIATLITPISDSTILFDTNKVKVVKSASNFALYFSRQAIPFQRDTAARQWIKTHQYYLHLGLYAYKKEVLNAITKLPQSILEQKEKLEQLRWLENGYRIKLAITNHTNVGIDTPEDLKQLTNQKNV